MQPDFEVAIIGAGFAGLGATIRLLQAGRPSFVVFERAQEVGGTWRDNTYPGCACDVPSYLYSYSFEQNPNWSQMYSPQPEILDYLKHCVTKYGLSSYIRLNTEIIATRFIDTVGYWELTTRTGDTITARVVIGAIGPLNRPSIPKLRGIDTFTGTAFHSANWNHNCDLTGKRVAVIGTGASAIQIVPEVANVAAKLYVCQRTAPYVMPRRNRHVSDFEKKLYQRVPILQHLYRSGIYLYSELGGLGFLGNDTISALGTKMALKHINAQIQDPELRRKVTPTFKFGCKRVLVSNDYYPALTRPNVELITEPIEEVRPTSFLTADQVEHPVDVIIYSTGFVAADIVCELNIHGRNGRDLLAEWAQTGAEAYKGLTVSGFPNLLFLVGPNTGLGHNSIVHIIESQLNYVMDYLQLLDKAGKGAFLDVKPDVQRAYNEALQERLKPTVWASGCRSWYMNAQGKNTTIWPGLNTDYRRETSHVNAEDYAIYNPTSLATQASSFSP